MKTNEIILSYHIYWMKTHSRVVVKIKRIINPTMKFMSSFKQPHAVLNMCDFLSFVEPEVDTHTSTFVLYRSIFTFT